ncbi:tRNA-intron lyase [Candidatus Woesearchaeota archaeon]|nr:tRNA-intron lyase [Candidatus Woesearchaeota archaeon]
MSPAKKASKKATEKKAVKAKKIVNSASLKPKKTHAEALLKKEIAALKQEESADESLTKWTDSEILAPLQEEEKHEAVSEEKDEKKRGGVVKSLFARERVITESSDEARTFYSKSVFGSVIEGGKVQLSLLEALYLLEKGKLEISEGKKKLTAEEFLKKARKVEPNFWIRYCVFKDMRNRGYIIKTALKFGADFRVYDRGIKPGQDHARWIIFPVHEGETLTWYEFAAKNRVAHSTKKRLMMGIVDDEGDVTYYEIKWMRP